MGRNGQFAGSRAQRSDDRGGDRPRGSGLIWRARLRPAAVVFVALATGACGYHVAGKAGRGLPPSIRTIAIPAFQNDTLAFKIEQTLAAAVQREFLTRTSYRVQPDSEGSDATLSGVVTALYSSPIVFDPSSGRTTEVLITVTLRVRLANNQSGETLYEANNWVFRESYEVSRDATVYFGENQPALERLSRQVAASLVTSILEGFE